MTALSVARTVSATTRATRAFRRPLGWLAVVALICGGTLGCRQQPLAGDGAVKPAETGSAVTPGSQPPAAPKLLVTHRPGRKQLPIIDVHGHLSLYGVDRIAAIMDAVGIEAIVNLSGGSGRSGGKARIASRLLAEHLGGRVLNFANVDWEGCCDATWAAREAEELRKARDEAGFVGLKISKALGLGVRDQAGALVAVDDVRLDPLWAAAAKLEMPVAIHIADPKAFWQPPTRDNERYEELSVHPSWSWYDRGVPAWDAMLDAGERMFARNPRTTFVAVHFGNAAEEPARVRRMLDRLPNVWIDMSARVGEIGRHPASEIRALFVDHQDRILFGTDIGIGDDMLMLGSNGAVEPVMTDVVPFYDAHFRWLERNDAQIDHPSPIQGRWRVDAIGLPDDVLDKVYRGNARRLFKLGDGPIGPPKASPPQEPLRAPAPRQASP